MYVARRDGTTISLHAAKLVENKYSASNAPMTVVDPCPSAHIGHTEHEVRQVVVDIVALEYGQYVGREVARLLQRNA